MKKLIGILTITAALCAATAAAAFTAAADTDAAGELFLPGGYEQYLELTAPSDFAISDKYVAISDKKNSSEATIYLYDKTKKEYSSCSFNTASTISSLNFYSCDSGDYLFFIETGNTVKYIDIAEFKEPQTVLNFNVSVMIIIGNEIYSTIQTGDTSTVNHASINDGLTIAQDENSIHSNLSTTKPSFSVYGDNVYLSANKNVYLCSSDSLSEKYTVSDAIHYFAVFGENNYDIVYSNEGGKVYFGNNANSENDIDGSCIKYFDGYMYLLTSSGISRYALDREEKTLSFDNYEIGKYSSSPNRINNAADLSIYDDKLVIADTGNTRVSVYDGAAFTCFDLPQAPDLVCAGENSYLAISGARVFLCRYGESSYTEVGEIKETAVSASYASGTFYLLCDDGAVSYAVDSATGAITASGAPNIGGNPVSIAADIYGYIYVLASSGQVDRYTHAQFFADGASSSEKIADFPANCKKLLTDYAQRLYALGEDAVYEYFGGEIQAHSLALSSRVFADTQKSALSFAFGLTDESVYVLSDGFIVKTDIGISTLNNIAAEGLYEAVYGSVPSAEGLIVTVKAGSVAVTLDFGALKSDSPYLPSLSYGRLEKDRTGVVLGKTEAGYAVLFYEYAPAETAVQSPKREYTVCLIAKNGEVEPVSGYYAEEEKTGYLSSGVYLYSRPAMQDFTQAERLERGDAVTVHGKVSLSENVLDGEYYYVTAASGAVGFIPASFVTDTDIYALQNENYRYQTLKKGKSATLFSESGESVTLENKERLKVYYGATATRENYSVVSYEKDGVVYYGEVETSSLYTATPIVLVTLFIILAVTAAVLLSMCYLLFRKKTMLDR